MLLKIKSFLILLLCVFKFFISGRANKKTGIPRKIVVIQTAKLGDMVCATPMFRAVKEKYPQTKVFVIGNKINEEALDGNKDVDGYFVHKNNFWRLIKRLKKEKIDFACDTNPSFLGLAMMYLAGIPLVVVPVIKNGYSPVETRLYKMLRKFVVAAPHNMGNYTPREYLRLLEPIGVLSENTKKHLYFTKQAGEEVDNFLARNRIDTQKDFVVGISPSVGNKIKKWEISKFAKLADYISSKYYAKIIIIGGENDISEAGEMKDKMNKGALAINTAGMFNVDELKALVSKLSLYVGVDTGPIYIAEAFNVPTIDIVGPMDENEQPPIGERHKIVKLAGRKAPAIHIMNSSEYDYKEARRQVEEITVDMVAEKLDELMSVINQGHKATKAT